MCDERAILDVTENQGDESMNANKRFTRSTSTPMFALRFLTVALAVAFALKAHAAPTGGVVAAGSASISAQGGTPQSCRPPLGR